MNIVLIWKVHFTNYQWCSVANVRYYLKLTNLSSAYIQAGFCNDFAGINGYKDGKPIKGNANQVRGASRRCVLRDLVPTEADVRSCRAWTCAARNAVVVVAKILKVNS